MNNKYSKLEILAYIITALGLLVMSVFVILIGGIKIRLKISIFYGEKVVHLADF